ncbi:MAG: PKD domain-containing protein, partial [Candidatus Omnitrophica bacterium]|nr:PKD domain-containing protein [Candidatus Omnitrophota bacterium]
SIFDQEDIKKGKIIADSLKGRAPFTVKFSFETEDEINDAEYLWDFDDDGIIDLITLMPQAEFIYNDPGVYMAKLDVRTADGIVMSRHATIYITNGNNNDKKPMISSNNVSRNKIGKIELSDKTSLVLPADALEQDDVVNIKRLESGQIPKESSLNKNKPIGEYREYKFENRKDPFNKEMIISIPYADENEDGIVDDKDIDELTLDVYWYDEKNEEWKILSDVLIFPKENIVTAKTSHFTIFGIVGAENKKDDSRPGNNADDANNCFIATVAFDSPIAKEVIVLREFRDKYLLKSGPGRRFVDFYYHFSPPIADFIKDNQFLKSVIRFCIKFLVILIEIMLK